MLKARRPRVGSAVTYYLHLRDYLWIMPAQVTGFYERDSAALHPAVSVVFYDDFGLSPLPGERRGLLSRLLGRSPGTRGRPGWRRAVQLVHRDHWIGDVPEEFWSWPDEAPMSTIIALQPGEDWRERMSSELQGEAEREAAHYLYRNPVTGEPQGWE